MGREVNNCPCEQLPPRSTTTTTTADTTTTTRRRHRQPVEIAGKADHEDVGCTGKSCRSCTAGVIADCVAVCCCPCAVVNLFTLTFFKLPWMIGRKCLGLGNKKNKKKIKNEEKQQNDINATTRKDEGLEMKSRISRGLEQEEEDSARCEADRVWLDLYKVDQLGFGRVSFTGIE